MSDVSISVIVLKAKNESCMTPESVINEGRHMMRKRHIFCVIISLSANQINYPDILEAGISGISYINVFFCFQWLRFNLPNKPVYCLLPAQITNVFMII